MNVYERLYEVHASRAYVEGQAVAHGKTPEDAVQLMDLNWPHGSVWKIERETKWSTPTVERIAP